MTRGDVMWIVDELLGLSFVVAAVTMTGWGWGPGSRSHYPPNLAIRVFSFVFGLLWILLGLAVRSGWIELK
jgi:hypothetical protein